MGSRGEIFNLNNNAIVSFKKQLTGCTTKTFLETIEPKMQTTHSV